MDVGDEAAADFEVVEEVSLGLDEGVVLLVDPDGADEIAEHGFEAVAGFGVGIAGVVGDDGETVVEGDAAGVGEAAELEDAGDGEDVVATGVGGLVFGFVFFATLFVFGDFFVDAFAFFLCFVGGEGFAVAGGDAIDADAVDGEAFAVGDGGFLRVAVAVQLLLLGVDVVGVVAAFGFVGFLVALYVVEEIVEGWEGFFVLLLRVWWGGGGLLRAWGECCEEKDAGQQVHGLILWWWG